MPSIPRPQSLLRKALTFNPNVDSPLAASKQKHLSGNLPLENVPDEARQNLEDMYQASKQMGISDTSNEGILDYTPAYVVPQSSDNPVRFMEGLGSGLLTMSKTSPAEFTVKMNGQEAGERNINNFLKRNQVNQSAPFPVITPKGLQEHVNRPLYIFRGVDNGQGNIQFDNAWGQAQPSLGIAAWNKSEEYAPRGVPDHEIDHLTNQSFPLVREIHGRSTPFLPGDIRTPEGRAEMADAQRKMYRTGKRLHDEALEFDAHPLTADADAFNHFDTLSRMLGKPGVPAVDGWQELQALMAQTKREAGQIHGFPVTEKDEIDLFRALMQDPIPFGSDTPKALHGPRQGQSLPFYNERQRAIQSIHNNSKKDKQELFQQLWLNLFSDNNKPQEQPYV